MFVMIDDKGDIIKIKTILCSSFLKEGCIDFYKEMGIIWKEYVNC